jgi:phage FluMu gp28-like protein
MAISLLYIDEFAFVQKQVAEQFWHSAMPSISTGGRVIITSTFNTRENMFDDLWNSAITTDDGFSPFKAIWKDHPDRDERWAANEIKMIGQEQFDLEHNCTFEG